MRFIDVTIPKFGDDDNDAPTAPTQPQVAAPPPRHNSTRSGGGFLSRPVIEEYNLEENESVIDETPPGDGAAAAKDEFFDAPDIATDSSDIHQKTFEFHFAVDKVQASLFKSNGAGPERHLADAALEGFALEFALRKFDLGVDVSLRSISLDMIQPGKKSVPLVSSNDVNGRSSSTDLIKVQYAKVQKDSPEFQTVFEGVDQTVQVELSTFNTLLDPAPVLDLYDWIMTTFVPEDKDDPVPAPAPSTTATTAAGDAAPEEAVAPLPAGAVQDKIRVRVKLVEFGSASSRRARVHSLNPCADPCAPLPLLSPPSPAAAGRPPAGDAVDERRRRLAAAARADDAARGDARQPLHHGRPGCQRQEHPLGRGRGPARLQLRDV